LGKDKHTFKEIEKQNAEVERFYKAWEQADYAQSLLKTALDILEETAKVFTKETICPTASFMDGIFIKWENFSQWGAEDFFSPKDFLDTCEQRKTKKKFN